MKNTIGILIRIALILYVVFVYQHFNNIKSSDPWTQIPFHLFVSSSIWFMSVSQFSVYGFFTFLVKFIPKYFIIFDAIANEIVFFISFSDSLLLVYSNAV